MTYYLIDFENIKNKGLVGCEALKKKDKIVIFYTIDTPYVGWNIIQSCEKSKVKIKPIQTTTGSQSLDKHLISYLGYLLCKKENANFVIISEDKGYDDIIMFWEHIFQTKDKPINISRFPSISDHLKSLVDDTNDDDSQDTDLISVSQDNYEIKLKDQLKEKKEKQKKQQDKALRQGLSESEKRLRKNNELQEHLKGKMKGEKIGKITSIVMKHYSEKNAKQLIRFDLINKYGINEGEKLFKYISHLI